MGSDAPTKVGQLKKLTSSKDDQHVLTEKFQEEILCRASNTLASLARVAIEVLGVKDMRQFAAERRLDASTVYEVPSYVFSKEVVRLVANSISSKPSLVVRVSVWGGHFVCRCFSS